MAARGHGAIVNVTTMVAEFGMPGLSTYGASKAATALLTKAWAAEYGPHGVRVNAVSPGPTRTPATDAMGDGFAQIVGTIPLGRAAEPDEIAQAIVFLASDRASYLNGAVVPADGGEFRLADSAPRLFTMLVFNRGLHCPVCRAQLSELDRRFDELAEKGIDVVSISGESEQRASQMRDEWKIDKVPLAYGLSEAQMREWGLFVSRGITADAPAVFNEPALFLISPDGSVYYESILSIPAEAPAWTTCSLASTTGPPTTTPRAAAPSRLNGGDGSADARRSICSPSPTARSHRCRPPTQTLRARPLLRTATLSAPPSGYGGEWPGRSARSRSAGNIESPIHWRLRRPTGTPDPSRRGRSTACGSPRSPPYAAGDAPAGTPSAAAQRRSHATSRQRRRHP